MTGQWITALELAARVGNDPATTEKLLVVLEREGLVERGVEGWRLSPDGEARLGAALRELQR